MESNNTPVHAVDCQHMLLVYEGGQPKTEILPGEQTSPKHGDHPHGHHCCGRHPRLAQQNWGRLGSGKRAPTASQPSSAVLLKSYQCLKRAELKLFQGKKKTTKPCLQINLQTSTLKRPFLQPPHCQAQPWHPGPWPSCTGCPRGFSKGLCSPLQSVNTAKGNK